MINKRLISLLGESKRYIFGNVACQWGMLLSNIALISVLGVLIVDLAGGEYVLTLWPWAVLAFCVVLRHILSRQAAKMSALASKPVKKTLRAQLYKKLLRLGASYAELVPTAEVVQVATEGVEQLETYYGAFLPQFFYSMLAPLTLFAFLAFIHFPTALVLLILVPLIPVAIMVVQKIAKRMLGNYWGQYAKLGDSFLENLMGLTTLKIYQADGRKAQELGKESEHFRKVTMKVLTMQLNSITVMDIIAYGGAAVGLSLALVGYGAGSIDLWGCFVIIMLSAEFFLPLRALGSYFHTAMNGMAASGRMFRILDMEEPKQGTVELEKNHTIRLRGLSFSYDGSREVLSGIDMDFPEKGFTSIVGESGSGKSTIAAILTGQYRQYSGAAVIADSKLEDVREDSLMKTITYIGHNSYLFKGTVAENLRLAKSDADDGELWQVLERVKLKEFLVNLEGLNTAILENGANLSGGQRQRLAIARGLLHDSPIYIFDEATSNIDVESENDIVSVIQGLTGEKSVIMISHRLSNVVNADRVYVLDNGRLAGAGTHSALLEECAVYRSLWNRQKELEKYGEPV